MTREALHPKAVHDLKQLISKVVEWEDKWARMAAEHKETLPVIWKMAALMELCPPDVQDVVYQNVDGVSEDYDKLKQRILAWAANKVANSVGPVPMDVGWVHNQEQDERVEQEDVGAVTMNTVCHGCGGCGHLKWECPTLQRNEKANRKGGYEKGKGKGKGVTDVYRGGDKGKGKGDKGAGKGGFKGTCYKCGKQGHRAADCRTRVDMVDEYEDEDECEMQPVGGVWTIGQIEVQKNRGSWQAGNRFAAIAIDDEDEIPVMAVEHVDRTRESAIEFNVAEVRKPLASAVRMVMAGNRVVLDSDDSYIENRKTGERMKLKVKDGTYVFDVQCKDGEVDEFTLDSGAGVNVWPQGRREDIPMMPKRSGLRMCAANGTEIQNLGRKIVQFRGVQAVVRREFTRLRKCRRNDQQQFFRRVCMNTL